MKIIKTILAVAFILIAAIKNVNAQSRKIEDFDKDWKFFLGSAGEAQNISYNDAKWRSLSVPHDWSIEGKFDRASTVLQQQVAVH